MEALKSPVGPFDPSQFRYKGPATNTIDQPKTHSQYPVTTGTSVVAVAYDGGVMMAADTLASYGSLARYGHVSRLVAAGKRVLLGCGGDFADCQFVVDVLEQNAIAERSRDDGVEYEAPALHSWLTRVLYNRRSRFDPLWTTLVVAGCDESGAPYLGYVDKLGTAYRAPHIATGLGAPLITPLLREATETQPALTEEQARELLQRCMAVSYYRDCRAHRHYQLAIVTRDGGVVIESPTSVQADWQLAHFSKTHDQ